MTKLKVYWEKLKGSDFWALYGLTLCFFTINFHNIINPETMVLASWIIGLLLFGLLLALFAQVRLKALLEIRFTWESWATLVLWMIFAVIIGLSELRGGILIDTPVVLVIIPLLMLLLPQTKLTLASVYQAMFLSTLPFFAVSLLLAVLGNKFSSNSIGLTLVTGAIAWMALDELTRQRERHYQRKSLIFLALAFLLLFVIGSRTSLIIFMSCLLWYFRPWLKGYSKKKWLMATAVIAVVGVGMLLFMPDILTKWSSDISSGRFRIWKISLTDMSVFGEGYFYYSNRYILGPHHTFIGILAFHGLIGLIAYTAFFVNSLFLICKQYYHQKKEASSLILVTIGLLVGGMFEGFVIYPSYRLIGLVWFIGLGYLFLDKSDVQARKSMGPVWAVILSVISFVSVYVVNPPWFTQLIQLVIH